MHIKLWLKTTIIYRALLLSFKNQKPWFMPSLPSTDVTNQEALSYMAKLQKLFSSVTKENAVYQSLFKHKVH